MLGWRRVPAAKRLVNMRILLGWELGAGLGHVGRLKVVADRLRADGAEISVALQDLRRADIFTDAGYPVVQGRSGRCRPIRRYGRSRPIVSPTS